MRTWNTFPNAPWPTKHSISKSSGVSFLRADALAPALDTGATLCSKPLSMRRRPPFSPPPPSASRDLVRPDAGLDVRAGLGAGAAPGDALRLPAPPKSSPETPAEMADQAWSMEGAAVCSEVSPSCGPRASRSEGESNPVVVLICGCDGAGLDGFRATGVAGGFPNPGAGRG